MGRCHWLPVVHSGGRNRREKFSLIACSRCQDTEGYRHGMALCILYRSILIHQLFLKNFGRVAKFPVLLTTDASGLRRTLDIGHVLRSVHSLIPRLGRFRLGILAQFFVVYLWAFKKIHWHCATVGERRHASKGCHSLIWKKGRRSFAQRHTPETTPHLYNQQALE